MTTGVSGQTAEVSIAVLTRCALRKSAKRTFSIAPVSKEGVDEEVCASEARARGERLP